MRMNSFKLICIRFFILYLTRYNRFYKIKKSSMEGDEMTEQIDLMFFQIISKSGNAKEAYIEAIQLAKRGKFKEARATIKEGEQHFSNAHKFHAQLISKEADGESIQFSLLLTHAEDQMALAELAKTMANEIIELYERMEMYV